MSIVKYTSCDNFANDAEMEAWWDFADDTGDIRLGTTGGRFGGGAIQMITNNRPYLNVPAHATYFVGFSFYLDAVNNSPTFGSGGAPWLWFNDSGTTQVVIKHIDDGTIRAENGSGTVLGTSDSGVIPTGEWRRLTAQVTVNNTTGVVKVWLDNDLILDITGADTQNTASAQITQVQWQARSGSSSFSLQDSYDDIIINDDQGSTLNGFLGDLGIEPLLPTADSSVQWTPSGGGTNFDEVDEAQNDGDTTYVNTATTNFKDLYTMANITRNFPSVLAVAVTAIAKKEDAGARTLDLIAKENVTEGAVNVTLGTDYREHFGIFATNPDTGLAWAKAEVDAMEAGFEAK